MKVNKRPKGNKQNFSNPDSKLIEQAFSENAYLTVAQFCATQVPPISRRKFYYMVKSKKVKTVKFFNQTFIKK